MLRFPWSHGRLMSTLAPKSTSKKTKSRHVVFPGMPYQRLTRSQYLDPLYNHKLQANKEISRRERHFRMILAQAMCASHPQNPDLTEFMPPYWLKCTNVHHQRAQLPGLDPLIQSTAHTRLVRATIARTDVQKKSQWIHRGLITENDIQQVESMIERAKSLPIPKLDRVLNRCEELISKCQQEELSLLLGEAYGVDGSLAENSESVEIPLQHRLTRDDVSSILGSPVHDAGRAILRQDEEIQLDEQRLQVERIIGLSTANSEQIYKYKLYQVMHAFQLHPTDVGSPQVQAAIMTLRIRTMCQHLYEHPQDTICRVRLNQLTHRRRKTLEYLKRVDFEQYMQTVKDLGLKFA